MLEGLTFCAFLYSMQFRGLQFNKYQSYEIVSIDTISSHRFYADGSCSTLFKVQWNTKGATNFTKH